MKNFISWFEIPALDISRAMNFYGKVLDIELELTDMHGIQMAFFPMDGQNVSGALVSGPDYAPSEKGVMIYLNAGDDLQPFLDRAEQAGGQIYVPKTEISPEMGYFAIFRDSEGNTMAFHSNN